MINRRAALKGIAGIPLIAAGAVPAESKVMYLAGNGDWHPVDRVNGKLSIDLTDDMLRTRCIPSCVITPGIWDITKL